MRFGWLFAGGWGRIGCFAARAMETEIDDLPRGMEKGGFRMGGSGDWRVELLGGFSFSVRALACGSRTERERDVEREYVL